MAIVGLSDQLVHERIEFERYTMEVLWAHFFAPHPVSPRAQLCLLLQVQLLQTEVAGLNQDSVDERTEVIDSDSQVAVSIRQHLNVAIKLDCVQEL